MHRLAAAKCRHHLHLWWDMIPLFQMMFLTMEAAGTMLTATRPHAEQTQSCGCLTRSTWKSTFGFPDSNQEPSIL